MMKGPRQHLVISFLELQVRFAFKATFKLVVNIPKLILLRMTSPLECSLVPPVY